MRYRTGKWRGHDNYICKTCGFPTLDKARIIAHVARCTPAGAVKKAPGVSLDFASDEAAEAYIRASDAGTISPATLAGRPPSGKHGGYTVADVRAAETSDRRST
jgi:hypothetical protein